MAAATSSPAHRAHTHNYSAALFNRAEDGSNVYELDWATIGDTLDDMSGETIGEKTKHVFLLASKNSLPVLIMDLFTQVLRTSKVPHRIRICRLPTLRERILHIEFPIQLLEGLQKMAQNNFDCAVTSVRHKMILHTKHTKDKSYVSFPDKNHIVAFVPKKGTLIALQRDHEAHRQLMKMYKKSQEQFSRGG